MMNREELNQLSDKIIGIAIEVHKSLGSGFIEKVYESAFEKELINNNLKYKRQFPVKVNYKNEDVGEQRIDFMIDDQIIVELKTVSELLDIHKMQMLSYLKTCQKKIGLILNFAKKTLGIKRMVNNF